MSEFIVSDLRPLYAVGISVLAPNQRSTLAALVPRTMMAACVTGVLI
ncbi:MAG: hypothetical protein JKY51_05145 [Opitutaceae bacterium]|nr:hypothetical protein [Opitutaceae bacterium]